MRIFYRVDTVGLDGITRKAPKVDTNTTVFPPAPGAARNYNVAPGTDPTTD